MADRCWTNKCLLLPARCDKARYYLEKGGYDTGTSMISFNRYVVVCVGSDLMFGLAKRDPPPPPPISSEEEITEDDENLRSQTRSTSFGLRSHPTPVLHTFRMRFERTSAWNRYTDSTRCHTVKAQATAGIGCIMFAADIANSNVPC